jgi:hypothetical protein
MAAANAQSLTGRWVAKNSSEAEGNSLTFVGEREANNNTRRKRNYTAVVEGGKLKLTMPGRGTRTSVMEFACVSSEPPKPLPPAPPAKLSKRRTR